jgi:hypothetical protein
VAPAFLCSRCMVRSREQRVTCASVVMRLSDAVLYDARPAPCPADLCCASACPLSCCRVRTANLWASIKAGCIRGSPTWGRNRVGIHDRRIVGDTETVPHAIVQFRIAVRQASAVAWFAGPDEHLPGDHEPDARKRFTEDRRTAWRRCCLFSGQRRSASVCVLKQPRRVHFRAQHRSSKSDSTGASVVVVMEIYFVR